MPTYNWCNLIIEGVSIMKHAIIKYSMNLQAQWLRRLHLLQVWDGSG